VVFKQKTPLSLAVGAATIAATLFLFVRPPDEDLIRRAVNQYAATLGPVREIAIHGTLADLLLQDGRIVYAEFARKDGEWAFSKELGREFERVMNDPAVSGQILQRLGEKLGKRFRAEVTFKEGLEIQHQISRDKDGLAGLCRIGFAFPKVGEVQKRGQYLETFRRQDGQWTSSGPGAIYDYVGK
jgi:hypothetical protein